MSMNWTSRKAGSDAGFAEGGEWLKKPTGAGKISVGVILLALAVSAESRAQLPSVEWLREHALAERPPGMSFPWNTGTQQYDILDLPASFNVPQSASGRDWYNDVCLVRDETGEHVAYAVCGYSYVPNYFNQNGDCPPASTNTGYPNPAAMETFEQRWGTITGIVAYYDLDGDQLWYHTYLTGSFDGIIQDQNGDLVVAGWSGQMALWPGMPGTAQPFYYNPTVGQPLYDVSQGSCDPETRTRKMVLMKLDRTDGHALWNHYYGLVNDPVIGMPMVTHGTSVAEVDPDGVGGYRAVGFCKMPIGNPAVTRDRPFIVDVDINGMVNWTQGLDASHPSGQLWADANPGG